MSWLSRLRAALKGNSRPQNPIYRSEMHAAFAQKGAKAYFADVLRELRDVSETFAKAESLSSQDKDNLFGKIESALEAAYESDSSVSLRNTDRALLSEISASLSKNPRLVAYVADRYLIINYENIDRYERPVFRRLINDLLSLIVRPPVAVPEDVARDILEFVACVRDDLGHQPYPENYPISTRWRDIASVSMRLISHLTDPVHIALLGMTRASINLQMPLVEDAERLRKLRADYDASLPELRRIGDSALALPGTTADCSGVPFSDALQHAFWYYRELAAGIGQDARFRVIVEIGSGYGMFVRILRELEKARCFVLIDLPEVLAYAYAFLRVNFPTAKVHVIKSPADIDPRMTDRYDFVFCPLQQLEHLKLDDVDLLINTYSFGEMRQECVDYILRQVHANLRPRRLFSINLFCVDKNAHFDASGGKQEGNEIVLNVQPEWWPVSFRLFPGESHGNARLELTTLITRSEEQPAEIVSRLLLAAAAEQGCEGRLKYLYFAALWTSESSVIEKFFDALRAYNVSQGFDKLKFYDFDRIGEVQFLRRRLRGLSPVPTAAGAE